MSVITKSAQIGGKQLTLETGLYANQASAAVVVRYGDTVVLAAVVKGKELPDAGFVPLQIEYQERLYAGGKIKGSRWVKREGRPLDEEILKARLIDRSLRPLFQKGYGHEVQVIITVLSVDGENNPDIPSIWAASAALAISEIPWAGPSAGIRVGFVKQDGSGSFVVNPTRKDMEFSELDLVVSVTRDAVVMLEAGVRELPEENVIEAIDFAHKEGQAVLDLIEEFKKEAGKKKDEPKEAKFDEELMKSVEKEIKPDIERIIKMIASKGEASGSAEDVVGTLAEKLGVEKKPEIAKIFDKYFKKEFRKMIIEKNIRSDGRKIDEVREIQIMVGVLPRTHGSAMFRRGESQALCVVTLGAPSLGQLIESVEGEETKRYIHHYNMPPYSVGETGRVGWPGRREIGHGALAERALVPVIPSEEAFPYTIRVVSEILSSNGSTSQASVCGSTLSLMDAGIPIKAPVSGIAMGLITEGDKRVILTDIAGIEDFNGDMDFKVAGTDKGITAMQLDVKKTDITPAVLGEAIKKAGVGRKHILNEMLKVMPKSREQISQFAPKVAVVKIPKDKIGEVIGPGGRIIRGIIEETGATVEVEEDGTVSITGIDAASVEKAVARVEGLTREVKPGEIYDGTVTRIQPFGAFVEILPGKEGLVHVSRMSTEYVGDPNDLVHIGQAVKVQVSEIDDMKRINLSMVIGAEGELPSHGVIPQRRPMSGGFGGGRPSFGGRGGDRSGDRRFDRGRR